MRPSALQNLIYHSPPVNLHMKSKSPTATTNRPHVNLQPTFLGNRMEFETIVVAAVAPAPPGIVLDVRRSSSSGKFQDHGMNPNDFNWQ